MGYIKATKFQSVATDASIRSQSTHRIVIFSGRIAFTALTIGILDIISKVLIQLTHLLYRSPSTSFPFFCSLDRVTPRPSASPEGKVPTISRSAGQYEISKTRKTH